MAIDKKNIKSDLIAVRVESDKLIAPASIGGRIQNFIATPEGSLLSITGPSPYLPNYGAGYYSYGDGHGIFHALLDNGNRDILLVHSGTSIKVFEGWNRSWKHLIGPSGVTPQLTYTLPNDTACRYPTQFVLCPNGIVIIPQGYSRAFFYNGEIVSELGYDKIPSAPIGQGPESTAAGTPNNTGYFGNTAGYALGDLHADFGDGRLGYVYGDAQATGVSSGSLAGSTYYSQYQHIDCFGNLSPLSGQSNVVSWRKELVTTNIDHTRKEILWSNIEIGRNGTLGRIFSRSKDSRNVGTADIYIVPGNAGTGTTGSFATLPDNVTTRFPDNVPDEALIIRPYNVVPVPIFKIACMAFGRLWIGGIKGDQGLVKGSLSGRWGTFTDDLDIYPDPSGGEPTGFWAVNGGMLIFTITSTFLLVHTDDGLRYRAIPLSLIAGCVAPDTIQNLPDGRVIWLGVDGFYVFDGKRIEYISEEIRESLKQLNTGRLGQATAKFDLRTREYRCYVSLNGSIYNDFCFVYDPQLDGWRERKDNTRMVAQCITKDHRQLLLGVGEVKDNLAAYISGVWVMDHSNNSYTPADKDMVITTSWLHALGSDNRTSPKRVEIWLRNTSTGTLTVSVYRDWSMVSTADDSTTIILHSRETTPPTYNTTTLGAADTYWVTRYPHWQPVDIFVPSCEVFKLKFSTNARVEILGIKIIETPHINSGRKI